MFTDTLLAPAIAPAPSYYKKLEASLEDKLFFLDHIPHDVSLFVDFGCADGAILGEVLRRRPLAQGIGYDIDLPASPSKGGVLVNSLDWLEAYVTAQHRRGLKSCLLLSSVVHEFLSQPGASFASLWDIVRRLGCDYVAVRDMAVEAMAYIETSPRGWEGALCTRPKRAHEFIEKFGSPIRKANALHYLLKIIHEDDWEREMQEDYLPLSVEAWHNRVTVGSGYTLRFMEHCSLPALRNTWRNRFGIEVPDPTHLKLVLRRAAR